MELRLPNKALFCEHGLAGHSSFRHCQSDGSSVPVEQVPSEVLPGPSPIPVRLHGPERLQTRTKCRLPRSERLLGRKQSFASRKSGLAQVPILS